MSNIEIPTFIVNLKKRTDRKKSVIKEFSGRNEFRLNIVQAQEHLIGAIGLWNTIKQVITDLQDDDNDFILLCEDDHRFTEHYSKELLFRSINEAQDRNADILSGGVSWFNGAVQVDKNLFWMQKFSATHFIIVFRKFFKQILDAPFVEGDDADYKISNLSENKFFIYPFISVQKEFGYSDITAKNKQEGRLDDLFEKAALCLENLKNVGLFYSRLNEKQGQVNDLNSDEHISIPTYIINQPGTDKKLEHIKFQFTGKPEFELKLVEPVKNETGTESLWLGIRKIVESAITNDDDVIIICQDDHEFTENYSKEYFLKNIFEAYLQGVNILLGGISHFLQAFPVTENRFWVDIFYGTQFIVLYRNIFQKILNEPFGEIDTADDLLSFITSNKMVLYPFITIQKEFSDFDPTRKQESEKDPISLLLTNAADRLEIIQTIYVRYLKSPGERMVNSMPLIELITKVNNCDFQSIFARTGCKAINRLKLHYRKGTCDEIVIRETFQDEIFEKGFPEYQIEGDHIIIDIGAHIGTYSLKLSQHLTEGIVHAFEPCLDTFTYLKRNVADNNIKNIKAHQIALSDHIGHTKLYHDNKNGNWGHSIVKKFSDIGEIVETDTLTNFFEINDIKKCDLMKFNCEGAEFKILLSTSVAVLKKVKYMLVLYHLDLAHGNTTIQLRSHLKEAGFYTEIRNESFDKKRGWMVAIQSSMQN